MGRVTTRRVLAVALLAAATSAGAGAAQAAVVETTAIEPASGPLEGGPVVLHGSGFMAGHTWVWWDGELTEATDVTPTTVTVEAPPHEAGEVVVRVQVGEDLGPALVYRYAAPQPAEPAEEPGEEDAPAAAPDEPGEQTGEQAGGPERRREPRSGPHGRRPGGGAVPDAVPDEAPPPRLAETGGQVGVPLPAGAVLAVAGTVLLASARRARVS